MADHGVDEGAGGAVVRVATALRRGVELLRAGRPEDAFEALGDVVSDPQFRAATDLGDIAARAFSLRAQAALESRRFDEADASAREALRRTRELGDSEGIAEVTALLDLVTERRQRKEGPSESARAVLRDRTLTEILAVADPHTRAEALLRKCQSSLADADRAGVLAAAELAWRHGAEVGDVRTQVLARLCAAHAQPEHAAVHLGSAMQAVDAGGSEVHALVTAVARTASQLGIPLPTSAYAGTP